jgi:P-type conjugative transfer protein TrbJ
LAKTFPGYKADNKYFVQYKKWSDTTLDTIRGVLRAAGLQSRQLATEQAVIEALRRKAASPVGRMQALQVLQQLAENQVEQLMKLRQLMIADLSSKQAYQAAVIQQKAATEAATERFFNFRRDISDGRTFRAGWR